MCELNTRCNINTIVLGPMKANTCVTKTKGIYKLYRKSNPIPHANYKYLIRNSKIVLNPNRHKANSTRRYLTQE